MTNWTTATRKDHLRFCEVEGWTEVRNAKGSTGSHHITLELALHDGEMLATRVSHPPDRTDYSRGLWTRILRDQLQVTDAQFWATVNDGVPSDRSSEEPDGGGRLPAEIAWMLRTRVGLAESEIAEMSKDQAVERLNRFWAEGS
ncbi:MAG: cytotoxic translational repressor of toxin-antitoxin stability system [Euzebya sp.]